MSLKSVYLREPAIESGLVRVMDDEHRHLAVARVERGERIEIFNGAGRVWTARVETIERNATIARVEDYRVVSPPEGEWILGQSLIRAGAFEVAVEKAVELGVTRIVPIVAARSNVRSERHERWERIVIEAAKQSKNYHLPRLDSPMSFERALTLSAKSKIVFDRSGGPLHSAVRGFPVFYLVGPEGGWTDHELQAARDTGFKAVSLGACILKSETAAIAGGALIRFCCWQEPSE